MERAATVPPEDLPQFYTDGIRNLLGIRVKVLNIQNNIIGVINMYRIE